MNYKELYEKIRDKAFSMRKGIANSMNRVSLIEQMKNILYNNLDAIEEALKYAAYAEDQIKLLELELADAERELDEAQKKTTQKTKKPAKGSDE